ncbi:interferon-induced transmembrane protein 3-like [Poecilia reticulata]|uniref:interferon-induced transmembrane protein 3-like n=1 Tax=Poecilia reticulata TaxID=8081 RepID=UPI0007EA83FD|nr:PREDICTED: interferon-induced transmembrane protein 3-like [Poecilia reticulata]
MGRHAASPGQPGGPTGVQHTTVVNIPAELPNNHIIWSLISFVYGNLLCLGLAALIFSIKARDRKMVGDQDGARRHAYTAHVLNVFVTSLAILLSIAALIVVIVNFPIFYRYH